MKEIAQRNKKNKANSKFPQRTGRTKFGQIIEEMNSIGSEPSRLDLFLRTRLPRNGVALDNDTRTLIEFFEVRLSQVPESERTEEFKEKLFESIMGIESHGHVRCAVKRSKTQNQSNSATSSFDLENISQDVIDKLIERLKEQIRAEAREEA